MLRDAQGSVADTSASSQAVPRSRVRRLARLTMLLLSSGTVLFTGCQGVSGSAISSQFRIIDASPDAPGLDFYQGTTAVAYNLGFGNVTSYIPTNPGTYNISANISGSKSAVTTASGTFGAASQYTVLVGNISTSLQELILKDQSGPAPGGQIALRFVDQATAAGAVDIYLVPSSGTITTVSPVLVAQAFSSNSGYLNVPAGTYKILIFPTGTIPTGSSAALYSGGSVTYSSSAARTIVLLDQQILNNPTVQVVTAADYDSPTATS